MDYIDPMYQQQLDQMQNQAEALRISTDLTIYMMENRPIIVLGILDIILEACLLTTGEQFYGEV